MFLSIEGFSRFATQRTIQKIQVRSKTRRFLKEIWGTREFK